MSDLKILKVDDEIILEVVSFLYYKNIEESFPNVKWTITPEGGSVQTIGAGNTIRYKTPNKYAEKKVTFRAFIKEDSNKKYPEQCLTCFIEDNVSVKGILIEKVTSKIRANVGDTVECGVIEYSKYRKPTNKITDEQKKCIKWDIKVGNDKKTLFIYENKEPFRGESIKFVVPKLWDGKRVLLMPYMHQSTEGTAIELAITNSENTKCSKCTEDWTVDDIRKIVLKVNENYIRKHIDSINQVFKEFGIDTCLRRIHFLAQVLHESADLTATKEWKASDDDYGGFPGGGLMQLTGKKNYEAYEKFVNKGKKLSKEDFTTSSINKNKLQIPPHAAKSAGWFWEENLELNKCADDNDFIHITKAINGGFNGYDLRLKRLQKAFETIYDKCGDKKEGTNTNYTFEKSRVYNDSKGSLAWGLWHDDLGKKGCKKNKKEAIKGYERCLENLKRQNKEGTINWNKINKIPSLSHLFYYDKTDVEKKKPNVKVKAVAEDRLKKLKLEKI